MNFPLLERVVEYANQQAAALGRSIDFSLTTNATLLTPAIIEFLSDNRIGVTVSMDGPPELHDALRVFANGRGSYDIIAPKVRELLAGAPHTPDRGTRHADLRRDRCAVASIAISSTTWDSTRSDSRR